MTEGLQINDLPLETFFEILLNVDGNSLGRCRSVCKEWKERIDGTEHLWQTMCENEFKFSSRIAKKKSGHDCTWYHIYKNLKRWSDLSRYEKSLKEFYKFSVHDKSHMLDVNYGIIPLKDSKGVILYEMSTFKYIPVAFLERNCIKIDNTDKVTIVQTKSGIFVQRTVDSSSYVTEQFFKADNFTLTSHMLYFYNNRDVFQCDLLSKDLLPKLVLHCDDIKEMQYSDGILHLFTDCGKIINIDKDNEAVAKPIDCPIEWVKQIKHIQAVNDRNFVCYSRNLIKIEVEDYKRLYLEFPPITALFFYVDVVLFGTTSGEILMYRLSSQKKAIRPIFETLAMLPEGKIPIQLDVCERRSGPTIIATTFLELYFIDIPFFPHEQQTKPTYTINTNINMYKRLLKLKGRLNEA